MVRQSLLNAETNNIKRDYVLLQVPIYIYRLQFILFVTIYSLLLFDKLFEKGLHLYHFGTSTGTYRGESELKDFQLRISSPRYHYYFSKI